MADNKTLPATGTGTANIVVATDEIGGVDYQRVKLALGADGTAADAPVGAGTEAGVLRVTVASDSSGVLSVDDNGASLTVDAPVGTPAFVRLSDGTAAIARLPVDVTGSVRDLGSATNIASQVTVTNSSTAIVAARATRRAVVLLNLQTVAVYVDPTGGTATTSMFRLDPGASITLPVVTAVTGITSAAYTASGDAKVHIMDLF